MLDQLSNSLHNSAIKYSYLPLFCREDSVPLLYNQQSANAGMTSGKIRSVVMNINVDISIIELLLQFWFSRLPDRARGMPHCGYLFLSD
jgi:hypothetical protein